MVIRHNDAFVQVSREALHAHKINIYQFIQDRRISQVASMETFHMSTNSKSLCYRAYNSFGPTINGPYELEMELHMEDKERKEQTQSDCWEAEP